MKLKLVILTLCVIFLFVGCGGNPPKPFSHKLTNLQNNLSDDDKKELLYITINKLSKDKFLSNQGCVSYSYKFYSSKKISNYYNCFFLKDSNYIKRIDKSSCSNYAGENFGECSYPELFKPYISYINELQNGLLPRMFKEELKSYDDNHDFMKLNKKILKINISLVDNTKILPKSKIQKLIKELYIRNPYNSKMEMYKHTFDPKSMGRDYKKTAYLYSSSKKDKIDRYKVNFTPNNYYMHYSKFPKNLLYAINNIYFNYVPEQFILNNKDISLKVSNKSSLDSITLKNNSNSFIDIDSIAGYYNGQVVDNILKQDSIRIPPNSYKTFSYYKFSYFPKNQYIEVNQKDQKINYGFSISYRTNNKNFSLYKTKAYSINSFK